MYFSGDHLKDQCKCYVDYIISFKINQNCSHDAHVNNIFTLPEQHLNINAVPVYNCDLCHNVNYCKVKHYVHVNDLYSGQCFQVHDVIIF